MAFYLPSPLLEIFTPITQATMYMHNNEDETWLSDEEADSGEIDYPDSFEDENKARRQRESQRIYLLGIHHGFHDDEFVTSTEEEEESQNDETDTSRYRPVRRRRQRMRPMYTRSSVKPRFSENGTNSCCFCLENMDRSEGLQYCSVGCGGVFHESCIQRYNKRRCPLCRHNTVFRYTSN